MIPLLGTSISNHPVKKSGKINFRKISKKILEFSVISEFSKNFGNKISEDFLDTKTFSLIMICKYFFFLPVTSKHQDVEDGTIWNTCKHRHNPQNLIACTGWLGNKMLLLHFLHTCKEFREEEGRKRKKSKERRNREGERRNEEERGEKLGEKMMGGGRKKRTN